MIFSTLMARIRACTICSSQLPMGARPVLQADPAAKILVVGQAPGRRVHESGIPFDDPSGVRLREWMGVDAKLFYDPTRIALVPMGFCYPGSATSGDLPPRKECAEQWRGLILSQLGDIVTVQRTTYNVRLTFGL
jgi:uracil-DNA glycosylase